MPSRKTILILTSGPMCRNPRVFKEAQTLGNAGYEVTVITVAHSERFEAMDRNLMNNAPFRKISIDLSGERPKTQLRLLMQRAATWAARRGARYGLQSAEAFGPYRTLLRMARAHSADLTIAHTEVALCVAVALAHDGRCVAADFEDWHSEDLLPSAQNARPLVLLRTVESSLLRAAKFTTTTSGRMARALAAAARAPLPQVIANAFPLQPTPPPRGTSKPPSMIWFSQTIGPGRGLEAFLGAWSQTTRPSRVVLLGDVAAVFKTQLLQGVAAHRRPDIEFLPLVPPSELPALLATHDVGLALESSSPRSRDLTITNKILQYLNAGLAVIATPTAGQTEVLSRAPGAAISINLDAPAALPNVLDALLGDRARLSAMGQAARHAAESIYCWEKQSPQLLALVEEALRASPGFDSDSL